MGEIRVRFSIGPFFIVILAKSNLFKEQLCIDRDV